MLLQTCLEWYGWDHPLDMRLYGVWYLDRCLILATALKKKKKIVNINFLPLWLIYVGMYVFSSVFVWWRDWVQWSSRLRGGSFPLWERRGWRDGFSSQLALVSGIPHSVNPPPHPCLNPGMRGWRGENARLRQVLQRVASGTNKAAKNKYSCKLVDLNWHKRLYYAQFRCEGQNVEPIQSFWEFGHYFKLIRFPYLVFFFPTNLVEHLDLGLCYLCIYFWM